MTLRKLSIGLFCAASLFSGASQATLLLDASKTSSFTNSHGASNFTSGTAFTVADTITIDGLGWMDAEGNGLAGSHQVGLWNAQGTLLASVTVNNASTRVLSAQGTAVWYVTELQDMVLTKGTYRVAGTMNTDATDYLNGIVGTGVGVVEGYVRSGLGQGFSNPNEAYGQNYLHATVTSHQFDPEVPEPASLALFGLGVGALAMVRRQARRR
jgi:hypothetical protein